MRMRMIVLVLMLLSTSRLLSQTCTALGQNPSTAFPVCGDDPFIQATVPICGGRPLPVPGCGNGYADTNPYWYRFTCYASGTLGFLVTPNDLGDDYDWQLYDITGRNPDDVYTDASLIVTGNWAGTYGVTGASATGVNYIQCGSVPASNLPSFAAMPNLIVGHVYILLISHFTPTQSGYKLSFGGGTALITDPKLPKLDKAYASCGGVSVTVILNKKMKCSSLATDGSDFALSPALANIVAASGNNCSNSFDMDTVVLTMGSALPPGNYTITSKNGIDNNTLLDLCDKNVPVGDQVPFIVFPVLPTPMDSLTKMGCAPGYLDLVFRKPILCNSIAPNGSDFIVTGTGPVTVTGATGTCVNGLTTTIKVQLSAPIETAGNYQVQLVRGTDGNTIIDECGQETPAGATLPFVTKDTVNADFTYQVLWGCKFDTVACSHDGRNGVNDWNWNFDNISSSQDQHPSFVFPTFGTKKIQLTVTNGVCKDSTEVTVVLDNEMKAAFSYPDVLCPEDLAVFKDNSIGKIVSWQWKFDNGVTSIQQQPVPQKYPRVTIGRSRTHTVQLVIQNDHHCFDTAVHQLKVVNTCYIAVPNAFTPNGDANNDQLYPLNAYKTTNLTFKVYNRYGQVVFQTNDWTKRWDGTFNGQVQATGVYVWMLRYTERDTGKEIFRKGTTVLIR